MKRIFWDLEKLPWLARQMSTQKLDRMMRDSSYSSLLHIFENPSGKWSTIAPHISTKGTQLRKCTHTCRAHSGDGNEWKEEVISGAQKQCAASVPAAGWLLWMHAQPVSLADPTLRLLPSVMTISGGTPSLCFLVKIFEHFVMSNNFVLKQAHSKIFETHLTSIPKVCSAGVRGAEGEVWSVGLREHRGGHTAHSETKWRWTASVVGHYQSRRVFVLNCYCSIFSVLFF